jgi:hypothetical protein
MRISLIVLALPLLTACPAWAAPAPFPRSIPRGATLPEEVQRALRIFARGHPETLATFKAIMQRATTEKERRECAAAIEDCRRRLYTDPVTTLEAALKQPEWQSRNYQAAIKAELEKYRKRLEEAKKKGLFK